MGVTAAVCYALCATPDRSQNATGESDSEEFDSLACDGSANYIKCMLTPDGIWEGREFKARSFGRDSKSQLQEWITETYSTDTMRDLPPVTEDRELLTWDQAVSKAMTAVEDGAEVVFLPLGMSFCRVLNYRAIKLSAFVFQTPKQRATVLKQVEKFEKMTGCGLELLTLRRSYGGRQQGSLKDLAEQLYTFIQEGGIDLTKKFNLTRRFSEREQISRFRRDDVQILKDQAESVLFEQITGFPEDLNKMPTGLVISADNLFWIG